MANKKKFMSIKRKPGSSRARTVTIGLGQALTEQKERPLNRFTGGKIEQFKGRMLLPSPLD